MLELRFQAKVNSEEFSKERSAEHILKWSYLFLTDYSPLRLSVSSAGIDQRSQ